MNVFILYFNSFVQVDTSLFLLLVEDNTVVLGLEPLHGVLLGQPVLEAHAAALAAPVADVHAGPSHHHVEVHTVDTDARVVPDRNISLQQAFKVICNVEFVAGMEAKPGSETPDWYYDPSLICVSGW